MSKEKNLKPFEKGVSGNPGGRPNWSIISKEIRLVLNDPDKAMKLVEKVYDLALDGNMRAVEFLADRAEGKVTQRVEISPHHDQPIKVFDMDWDDEDDAEVLPIGKKVSKR